jgi:DNA-binding GntR family transcriptional regulator
VRTIESQPGLVEQAYAAILDSICDGQLPAGERLTQAEIAERLNVSRQPVGQALGLLKAQGFVCGAGRRGLEVAPLSAELVRQQYEYRAAVDALAAAKAAERHTEADLVQGRAILAQGRSALAEGALARVIEVETAFHGWIYETADNPIIVEVMKWLWAHARRVIGAVLEMPGDWPQRVWQEHLTIFHAIAASDAELAAELARAHVEAARLALTENIGRDAHD